jgi:ubiquinone/menaquinone biosynthesis C-methylase UbiE
VGLDLSQIMIEEAKRRVQDTGLPLRFVQADIQRLPFEDATFDRCYADRIFIHLPDPQLALAELVCVTRPGGKIVIAEGDHESQVLDTPILRSHAVSSGFAMMACVSQISLIGSMLSLKMPVCSMSRLSRWYA